MRGHLRQKGGVRALEAHPDETQAEAGLDVVGQQTRTGRAYALDVVGTRFGTLESRAVVFEELARVVARDQPRLDERSDAIVVGKCACGGGDDGGATSVEPRETSDALRMQ